MNWHFLDENVFLSKAPGCSQGNGQEQTGRGSIGGREPDFGISLVVWRGCSAWCGEFSARTLGLVTEAVGMAPVWQLSGGWRWAEHGSGRRQRRGDEMGQPVSLAQHSPIRPYQLFSVSRACITLCVTLQGRRAAHR